MDLSAMSQTRRYALMRAANKSRDEAFKREEDFLAALRVHHGDINAACEAIGRPRSWYDTRRKRHPEFATRATALWQSQRGLSGDEADWELGFAAFRAKFFGMETPWFQQVWVDAIEQLRPGNILLALWPPEHGKSTLFEDYACYKLATDPTYRILVGTEEQGLGRKFLRRVRNRMEDDGPFPGFIDKWGPFSPRTGKKKQDGRSSQQPWGADYFDVYRKREHDERNYSMEARGITSAISGARTDHLHLDDIQSIRSLVKTELIWDMLAQDWLPRPGERGIITINGTRVGNGDIYDKMFEHWQDDLFQVLKFPAIVTDPVTKEPTPLWAYEEESGAGFTLEMLDRLRRKLGSDEVWDRTYMQAPGASARSTFSDEIIDPTKNPLRSVHNIPERNSVVWLGLDPSIGGQNCLVSVEPTKDQLVLLNIEERTGLQSNEEIMAQIEGEVIRVTMHEAVVTKVIIEQHFFQKGLVNDQRLKEMGRKYGFEVIGHNTYVNTKYDETIGVASMPSSFIRGEIDIPWAEDERTRHEMGEFVRQLKAWKPYLKGDRLRQDRVMAFWFTYVQWIELRHSSATKAPDHRSRPTRAGLPWSPTQVGLLLPSRS